MKRTVLAFAVFAGFIVSGYEKAKSPLMTEWGERVMPENAWSGYPRPQMERKGWTNLNGEWDYAVTSVTNTPGIPKNGTARFWSRLRSRALFPASAGF